MFRYEYLSDPTFLAKIDATKQKTQRVKLVILNWRDEPITSVEGRATAGSISVNGKSALRRQGSLTMVADPELYNITNIDNLISINKRVAIEIGFENTWNDEKYLKYPIIWFPQGVFVVSAASINKNMSSFTISVTLKDKMTLLNGENGGVLPTAITHHPLMNEAGDTEAAKVRDILYTLLTVYGDLPEEKIVIDNVPLRIKNAMRLTKAGPIYSTGSPEDKTFRLYTLEPKSGSYQTYMFNDNVGYAFTDFTYPAKELTSNPGESVVSVLDKIKNALGNYEYFFDINGVFRFQEIANFINEGSALENWADAINQKYLANTTSDVASYSFANDAMLTAIANTPQYNAIKNDIIIWGQQTDTKTPIRYHLLIDYIPKIDTTKTYSGVLYRELNKDGEPIGAFRVAKTLPNSDKLKKYATFNNKTLANDADWRLQIYLDTICNSKNYWLSLEIKEELPKLMNIDYVLKSWLQLETGITASDFTATKTWAHTLPNGKPDTDSVTWFLDILDVEKVPSLEWMAITNIGRREKVLNDKSVNCLFKPNFQDIVLIKADGSNSVVDLRKEAIVEEAFYTQISPTFWDMLSTGISQCAAYDIMRSMLHEITGYNESISLTTVPIYHLEPNTRIYVQDADTGINGDYMINSYSVPLTVGGTMTFSCSKAIERI